MEYSLLYLPAPIEKHIKIYTFDNADSKVIAAAKQGKIWERKLFKLYKIMIQPNDVVVDVGAFIGSHTVAFSHLAKEVHAFEPCRKPHDALSKTLAINKMDNVTLYKSAVTNKIGEDVMGSTFDGDSFIKRVRCSKKSQEEESVPTVTIDSLNLERCDLIKIDTEGCEWLVLEGAQETIDNYRPIIFFETFRKQHMAHITHLNEWCSENFYNWIHLKADDYLLTSI